MYQRTFAFLIPVSIPQPGSEEGAASGQGILSSLQAGQAVLVPGMESFIKHWLRR